MKTYFLKTLTLLLLTFLTTQSNAQSVFSIIEADADLQELENAIVRAGLKNTFTANNTFSFFAPNNEAMKAVPASILNSPTALKDFIETHVVIGFYKQQTLVNGFSISTMNLRNLTIKRTGASILVNGSKIIAAEKFAPNGVVHKIDKVIFKNSTTQTTVMSIIENSPEHSILETIIKKANLTSSYTSSNKITVFAPTDEAFRKLSSSRFEQLIGTNINFIKNYLDYQIVNKELFKVDFKNGVKFTATNNQELSITVNTGGTFVNNIKIIFAGLQAANGIVYVIKDVVIPQPLPKFTILDFINQSANHTTLKKYVADSNNSSKLDAEGSFTYFAATDKAFELLTENTINSIENDPLGALNDLIENHLLGSKEYISDLVQSDFVLAVNGYEIIVTSRFSGTFANDAKISTSNVEVDNGLVHVIDAVLVKEDTRFTVQDVLENNSLLSEFNTVVKTAKLDSLLNTEGPFTVFAPSNIAMSVLPSEIQDAISNNEINLMIDFIDNHIVRQNLLGTDFLDNIDITARNGFIISVSVEGNTISVNDIPFVLQDLKADNGVVHVIDLPLFEDNTPQTIYRYISENNNHTIAKSLIDKALLVTQYDGPGSLTFLAPTDDAFNALGGTALDDLLNGSNNLAIDLLLMHTLNSSITSEALINTSLILNTAGGTLTLTVFENDLFVNNAKVTVKDIVLDNGIIHVIDAVIVEPVMKNTIWDIIQRSEELSTIEEYVIAAQLENKYDLESPITFFAVTDDAFEMVSSDIIDAFNSNTNNVLNDFFLFHTTDETLDLSLIDDAINITMQNGEEVTVSKVGSDYFINNAQINVNMITGDNGVVFEIDAIIEKQTNTLTIYDVLSNTDSLSVIKDMVDRSGLSNTLTNTVDLTFFAPSNSAIDKVDPAIIAELNNDPSGLLATFVGRHLYNKTLLTEDMSDNMFITMSNGEDVLISFRFDGLYINNSRIVTENIITDNGIIHIVNTVVSPLRERLTAYDVISNQAELTTFKSAVDNAGLVSTFDDSELVTVFAPSNDAFENLGVDLINELMADPNGLLTDVLRFHYNNDLILSTFLFDGSYLTMNNGSVVNVTINSSGTFLNGTKIIVKDILCDNGVVHIIDAVIMPINTTFTVYDLISLNEDLSILKTAVDTVSLQDFLTTGEELTVFAPTNNAFNKLPEGALNILMNNENDELRNILLGHIVDGNVLLEENLQPSLQLDLANNTTVTINLLADGLYFNKSKIVIYDVAVDNGIVHIIDAVNIPVTTSTIDIDAPIVQIKVYPNPTQDRITLSCNSCAESQIDLNIFNSLGQQVRTINKYEIGSSINISNLDNGMYYATFQSNEKITTSFVKE